MNKAMNKAMLHPHFILFEKPKNELYLTFSAIADDDDAKEICSGIQNEIGDFVPQDLKNNMELDKTKLYQRINTGERFLYRYPRDTLHFSITNFLTYNIIDLNSFQPAREIIKETKNFERVKEKVKKFKELFEKEILKEKDFELKIKRIYLPGGIENSLALNVFPKTKNFFKRLKLIGDLTKDEMESAGLYHNFKIKAQPCENPKYFTLNIFRFICKDCDKKEIEAKNFYKNIEKISNKLEENPRCIKMKLCIVVSDPYLSNEDPPIDC